MSSAPILIRRAPRKRGQGPRLVCTGCGKKYRYLDRMERHLCEVHGMTRREMGRVVYEWLGVAGGGLTR